MMCRSLLCGLCAGTKLPFGDRAPALAHLPSDGLVVWVADNIIVSPAAYYLWSKRIEGASSDSGTRSWFMYSTMKVYITLP